MPTELPVVQARAIFRNLSWHDAKKGVLSLGCLRHAFHAPLCCLLCVGRLPCGL